MFNVQEQEERDFHPDSLWQHVQAQAIIDATDKPDKEWLLTDFDVWIKNPAYTGKPGRHPEDFEPDPTPTPEEYNDPRWPGWNGEGEPPENDLL